MVFKEVYTALLFITLAAGIVPLLLSFTIRDAAKRIKPIYPFICLLALATGYELFASMVFKLNTSYWFQLYALLEFMVIYYYYRKVLAPKYSLFFKVSMLLFLVIYLLSSVLIWKPEAKLVSTLVNQ